MLLLRLMSGNIDGRRADPTRLGHLFRIIVISNIIIVISIIIIMIIMFGTCLVHHQYFISILSSHYHYQHYHHLHHHDHDHNHCLLAAEGGRLIPPAASWAAGHVGSYLKIIIMIMIIMISIMMIIMIIM